MYNSKLDFNIARSIAFSSFSYTLHTLLGRPNITEKSFATAWFEEMNLSTKIVADGWYNPPPRGIAVLSGDSIKPCRISYDSLRNDEFWPGNNVINWSRDLFYCYCSPVSIDDGVPGDFSVTLYFGDEPRIKQHIKRTLNVTHEILSSVKSLNSNDIHQTAIEIIQANRMIGCGLSSTDPAKTNFGHTLPNIGQIKTDKLSKSDIELISQSRKFINGLSSWTIHKNWQATFEPQLKSADDSSLPQISYHYILKNIDNKLYICDDVNSLISEFGL